MSQIGANNRTAGQVQSEVEFAPAAAYSLDFMLLGEPFPLAEDLEAGTVHHRASACAVLADLTDFWWNPKHPAQAGLWESKVRLSESFFNEIVSHPVPLDLTTLKALKRSPLGLDLYLWLVYRTFTLRTPLRITWRQVYRQFGAHPDKASDKRTVDNFRTKCLRELKKDQAGLAGPELRDASGCLDSLAIGPAHFPDP